MFTVSSWVRLLCFSSLLFFFSHCVQGTVGSESEININFAGLFAGYNPTSSTPSPTPTLTPTPTSTSSPPPGPTPSCAVTAFESDQVRKSLFADLTADEINEIIAFLALKNITTYSDSSQLTDDIVKTIELYTPPKSEALRYLDANGPTPSRYARVIVYAGSIPEVKEYKVGPLPNPASMEPITYFNRTIQWNSRAPDALEYGILDGILIALSDQANQMFEESFGGWTYSTNCTKCLGYSDAAPRGSTAQTRQTWFWFFRDGQGKYLLPVGIEILINHPGTDTSQWGVAKLIYNGVIFNSTQDMIDAYNNNQVPKIRLDYTEDTWAGFTPRGPAVPGDEKPAPEHFEPAGKRWTLEKPNKVNYMGWEFEFGIRPTGGMNVWNAKFNGKRIAYEVSLQDTLASYSSGVSAFQARSMYQDPVWGLGTSFFELKHGVDCPITAAFVNYTAFVKDKPRVFRNAICIFEQDLAYPLKKHFETDFKGGYNFYAGAPAYALVMRASSTIYNYDYIFDYIFHPHGVMEIKTALGGYIQAFWSTSRDSPYSVMVQDHIFGSYHDHIFSYKIDVDVEGVQNTFRKITTVAEQVQLPFFDQPQYQKKLIYTNVTSENNSTFQYSFDAPSYFTVINPKTLNKWGNPKGIRLVSSNFVKNLLDTSPNVKGYAWSKYSVAVTKQKDSERFGALLYAQATPLDYVLSFDDYLDGDNLEQQDLVCWLSVGVLHLPHAEDIPTQPPVSNEARIYIKPFNMFDEDPSMALRSEVIISRDTDGNQQVYDGRAKAASCVPQLQEQQYNGLWN